MAEVGYGYLIRQIFLNFVDLNAHFISFFPLSLSARLLLIVARECRRGRFGVLQRPSLIPDAGADDAFGARPNGRKQSTYVPHPLGGAARRVHRGQECLHGDQVQLTAAPG